MMTIIIELFSFLFWARSVYGGTSSEPCKVSTHNTNDYMHPDYLGVTEFLVDPTNVGCGQTEFKWRDGGSATILTPISCDAVGENYVINSIIYASLGMVAGSCGELNDPYVPPTDVKEQDAPSWCIEEENNYEYICCFGDDEYFINIPDEIGQECIGESECEISVWSWGLSIERKLVAYDFSDDENAILTRIKGPWGLKVLFECGPVTVSTSAPESEYSEYKFDLNDSEFSEYPDVSVKIFGYCTHGTGITENSEFNECVYDSFRFKVYSEGNYLGQTRYWKARNNVESCNQAYSDSLPVRLINFGTNQIHFTVTKTGGKDC